MDDTTVSVRYMADDVQAAIDSCTTHPGLAAWPSAIPAFADVTRGSLRLLLAEPSSSAGRPMPGGWNRPHIKLLRDLVVEREQWLEPAEFEDAIAACNLLPGPASTQLAIFCAWRLRGRPGAIIGGAAFIIPGLILILALAALFLGSSPPRWVLAAGAGAGAAVAAVA